MYSSNLYARLGKEIIRLLCLPESLVGFRILSERFDYTVIWRYGKADAQIRIRRSHKQSEIQSDSGAR